MPGKKHCVFCLLHAFDKLLTVLSFATEMVSPVGTGHDMTFPTLPTDEPPLYALDEDKLKVHSSVFEYFIDNDVGIISLSTYFIRPNAIIKISYDAGYPFDSIPFDLRMATLLQTQYFLKSFGGESGSKLGLKSFSKMNENVTKDDNLSNYGLVSEVVGLLESYKRMEAPLIQSYRGTV